MCFLEGVMRRKDCSSFLNLIMITLCVDFFFTLLLNFDWDQPLSSVNSQSAVCLDKTRQKYTIQLQIFLGHVIGCHACYATAVLFYVILNSMCSWKGSPRPIRQKACQSIKKYSAWCYFQAFCGWMFALDRLQEKFFPLYFVMRLSGLRTGKTVVRPPLWSLGTSELTLL